MKERFVVNDHIDVVLEDDNEIHVYIDGEQFIQCLRLVLNIPLDENHSDISSIDDAKDNFTTIYQGRGYESRVHHIYIDPHTEFLGHCSNIQAWVENDYNTRILHSNISFPLLKELASKGDVKAMHVLDAEIRERFSEGSESTREIILEIFSDSLDFNTIKAMLAEVPVHEQVRFWKHRILQRIKARDKQDVLDSYREAIRVTNNDATILAEFGYYLLESNDTDGAIDAFRTAIQINPSNKTVWSSLKRFTSKGDAKLRNFLDAEIRERFKDGSRPTKWTILETFSDSFDFNTLKTMIAEVQVADQLNLWRGLIIQRKKSHDNLGVINSYREALRLNSKDSIMWAEFGTYLLESNDMDGGIKALGAALDIDPYNKTALSSLEQIPSRGDYTFKQIETEVIERFKNGTGFTRETIIKIFIDSLDLNTTKKIVEQIPVDEHLRVWHHIIDHKIHRNADNREIHDFLREALRVNAKDSYLWEHLGSCSLELNDLDGAINAYREVVSIDSRKSNAWFMLGHIYLKTGKVEEAIDAYRKSLDLQPAESYSWYNLGLALERKKALSEAIRAYVQAIDLDPQWTPPWYRLENLYFQRRESELVTKTLKGIVILDPENANAWIRLGYYSYYPVNRDAYIRAGKIHSEHHQYTSAIKAAFLAVKSNNSDPLAWQSLGDFLKGAGCERDAAAAFSKAKSLDSSLHESRMGRKTVDFHTSPSFRWIHVLGSFVNLKIIITCPILVTLLILLSIFLWWPFWIVAACTGFVLFILFLKVDERDQTIITMLQDVPTENKITQVSMQHDIGILPKDYKAIISLGKTLKKIGALAATCNMFQKAIKIQPDNPEAWNMLSCVYTEGGRLHPNVTPKQSQQIIETAYLAALKAIKLAPDEGLYHTTLGEVLEASGQVERAIQEYKKALQLNPSEKYAIKYLRRLGAPRE